MILKSKQTEEERMYERSKEAPRQGFFVTIYNEEGEVVGGKYVTDRKFYE